MIRKTRKRLGNWLEQKSTQRVNHLNREAMPSKTGNFARELLEAGTWRQFKIQRRGLEKSKQKVKRVQQRHEKVWRPLIKKIKGKE